MEQAHSLLFFAMKLSCQYSYLDKVQNTISFPLLPPHPQPSSFTFLYLCALLERQKWAEGCCSRKKPPKLANKSLLILTVFLT